jgi:DNA-binding NarL/FixJ family response regulator
MIRVCLVDDQTLVRQGVRSLLELADNIEVIAEASDGRQAIELIPQVKPDVVLMDMRMPVMSGLEALQALAAAGTLPPTIILTTFDDDQLVLAGIKAGARGYLLKDVPFDELLDAIRGVHRGEQRIPAEIASKMAERIRHGELTAREVDVLKRVASGLANKEIAVRLSVSEGTVKRYVVVILSKLGARDRTHAVTLALERGIIDIDDVDLRP